jgi:hypothetical protein
MGILVHFPAQRGELVFRPDLFNVNKGTLALAVEQMLKS